MDRTSESAQWRIPPRLAPYLRYVTGYCQSGYPPGVHRGLPSPYLTMVVTLDDGLRIVQHSDPSQAPATYEAIVGGMHTVPVLLGHDGAQTGIQLSLTPLGSRALLGMPAGELADVDAHADQVLGTSAIRLREQLGATATWPVRFTVLERWLNDRIVDEVVASDQVGEAWRRIGRTRGAISVTRLGAEVGWSSRHLRARFSEEIGLTPKAAARVVRFDLARRMLQRRYLLGGAPELARLAAATGYADQAHLAREFREHAGCSATEWLRTEFPNVQATAGHSGRESAA